jgi:hypothetical protein
LRLRQQRLRSRQQFLWVSLHLAVRDYHSLLKKTTGQHKAGLSDELW